MVKYDEIEVDGSIYKLPIEVPAPLIANRAPVNKPLYSGIRVIDICLANWLRTKDADYWR
jgi:F0F1-type ATP synthase alpha subunit